MIYFDTASAALPVPDFFERYMRHVRDGGLINTEAIHRASQDKRVQIRAAEGAIAARVMPETRGYVYAAPTGSDVIARTIEQLSSLLQPNTFLYFSGAEHAAIADNAAAFFGEKRIVAIPLTAEGRYDFTTLPKLFARHTPGAVFVSHVTAESGVLNDLQPLRAMIKACETPPLFFVDAVQAFGKHTLPPDVKPDGIFFSSHKWGAPPCAALVHNQRCLQTKLLAMRENHRCGRLDAATFLTFSEILPLLPNHFAQQPDFADYLNEKLHALAAEMKHEIFIFNEHAVCSPWIYSFMLADVQSAILLRMLGENGIMISSGSACESESPDPPRLLRAMHVSKKYLRGMIRLSFAPGTTAEEIDVFIAALRTALRSY